ncbi:TESMIN isoform 8 [Pongo abelii]|uniref:TESMIN isoform 8 n=1 Tax=Pongo abelii TaxID=9601 RepID=A0A2J8U0S6_PONAB|nr:TESMIN isoform 8 [Pongo abelii]
MKITSPQLMGRWFWSSESSVPRKVEIKEAGGTITSNNTEEATLQNLLAQESCCKFPSSQELEDASCCSLKKDSNPMMSLNQ